MISDSETKHREREARSEMHERCERVGIPTYAIPLLAKPDETQALRYARRLLDCSDLQLLVLAGPPGVGKTIAGAWWASLPVTRRQWNPMAWTIEGKGAWAESVGSSRFESAIELVRHGTYGEGVEFWDDLKTVDRLVLDDLGTEPLDGKGYALANFSDVLTQRHAWKRQTLITTNLPQDAFSARYLASDGGRLRDRFREGGLFFEVTGSSLRKRLTLEGGAP